jgi:hypothetical protein
MVAFQPPHGVAHSDRKEVAMRRILTTGTVGLLATLIALSLSAGTAAARTASGNFALQPGQTIHFTNMSYAPTDNQWDTVAIFVSASPGDWANAISFPKQLAWGTLAYTPDPNSYTNTGDSLQYATLYTQDSASGSTVSFLSNHKSYANDTLGDVNHATLGYVKGKAIVSLNDSNGGNTATTNDQPLLGQGDFNATVTVTTGSISTGAFTVKPGLTIYLTNMNIWSDSTDAAHLVLYDSQGQPLVDQPESLGDNYGADGFDRELVSTSWTNDTGSTVTAKLMLDDVYHTGPGGLPALYYSDGTSENTDGSWDHAVAATVERRTVVVSIEDSVSGLAMNADYQPVLGNGNFNATVSIGR